MTRPANPELVSAIVRSASDLIAEKGPEGVTLREIAGQLGVTTTTVHYYFGDRDGLMATVRAAALAELAAALTVAGARDASIADQLRAVGRALVAWAREAPNRYALVFPFMPAGAAGTGVTAEPPADVRRILRSCLREILDRGRRRGELALDSVELHASLALCWLVGVAVVDAARDLPAEQQIDADTLLDGALSAFLAPHLARRQSRPPRGGAGRRGGADTLASAGGGARAQRRRARACRGGRDRGRVSVRLSGGLVVSLGSGSSERRTR